MRFCVMLALVAGCGGNEMVVGSGCAADGECPLHQFCEAQVCRTGCLADSDCDGARCNAHGRCAPADDAGTGDPDLAVDAPADLTSADDATDLSSCPGACPDTALEPNDSSGTATAETLPSIVSGLAICPANDEDWYTVTAPQAGSVHVVLTRGPCGPAVRADWYSSGGGQMIGSSTATTDGWEATATVKLNQVRLLRVTAVQPGDQNTYALALSIQ